MPKKCVMMSFGFDSSVMLRAYSEYDLESEDKVVLVVPMEENARSDSAVKDVESFLSSLRSRGVDIGLDILKVNANDIEESVTRIVDFLGQTDRPCYLEATGGVRSICVALTIVGTLLNTEVSGFRTINEANGQIISVSLPCFDYKISNTKKEILNSLLREGSATTKHLSTNLGRDVSTINRHLSELEKQFLVERDSKYDAEYRLTYIGKVLLKL